MTKRHKIDDKEKRETYTPNRLTGSHNKKMKNKTVTYTTTNTKINTSTNTDTRTTQTPHNPVRSLGFF